MGFWSNTNKIVSSSGKAFSNGMHLLAEGAAELERISGRFRLDITIKTLELKRESLGDRWFSPENLENHQELLDSYHERLRTSLPNQSPDLKRSLDKLLDDQRSLTISENLKTIQFFTSRLEASRFSSAIDAIDARKKLISMLRELIRACSGDPRYPIVNQAKEQIEKLEAGIVDLEPARRTSHVAFHDSGIKKSSAIRFDGKMNEIYEAWHENGSVSWRIPFDAGKPVDTAKHWRENGTLILAVTFEGACLSVTALSSRAEPLAHLEYAEKTVQFELLPKELENIKYRHVCGKPLSRFKLVVAFKILLSPKALKFIWNARKPGWQKDLIEELTVGAEELESGMTELESILGIRHKIP